MDPTQAIAQLVLAGAAAAGKEIGGQAVKDAYAQIKGLLGRLVGSDAALEQAEAEPETGATQAAVETALAASGAANDPEVMRLAAILSKALAAVDRAELHAASIRVGDVTAAGSVVLDSLAADGDIALGDLSAQGGDVSLSNLTAGRGGPKKA